jgi:hypothetical protein
VGRHVQLGQCLHASVDGVPGAGEVVLGQVGAGQQLVGGLGGRIGVDGPPDRGPGLGDGAASCICGGSVGMNGVFLLAEVLLVCAWRVACYYGGDRLIHDLRVRRSR